MNPPRLTRRDLVADLERLYGAAREHFLVAFHGTGDEDQLDVLGAPVRVVPVRGELELRRRLLDVGDADRVAFLVPWTVEIPLDLQGRFAKSGRVFRIGRDVRVGRLFGAAEVDPAIHGHPLVDYLLAHHAHDTFALPSGRLTVDAMWAAWLDRACGVAAGGELALDVLLGWAALDAHGARFTEQLVARGASAVRDALLAYLAQRLGPAGPVVWRAWEQGRGAAALELALVVGALGGAVATSDVVAMWVRTTATAVLGDGAADALPRLGAAADTALRDVERRAGPDAVRRLVHAADARAADDALRPHLIGSTRLPSAWRARLARLGERLAAAAAAPGEGVVAEAIERLRSLSGHDLFAHPEQTPVVRRAEMAVRLAGWLAARADARLAPAVTPYGDVEALAGWYVTEGGYVDWARRAARGSSDDELGRGVAAVVAAADHAREALDLRFARALPAWQEARRPSTHVVPIDQAVKRLVGAFLDEDADRRLLVVLMDGMAWPQAAELLESLGQRASVWGPLAWHGMSGHRFAAAPFPPVITTFPTLTEVSRAAFFAGAPMPVGARLHSEDDPKRWQACREAQRFAPAGDVPQLLLRGEGQARDGSASAEALSRVADRQRRLVAVVINAIDMSLKSDAAHQHRWTVDAVKSLRELLDKAAEHGRAVLLCSDHGHVPSDRLVGAGVLQDGARWRTWERPDAPLAAHEVGLRAGDGVWAPAGAHGVVLVADDAHRYGGGAGSGEHGGGSLAEAIAPCLFIGNADAAGAADDDGQAVRPARPPAWWTFDVIGATTLPELEPAERRPRRGKPAAAQLTLTGMPAAPAPTPAPAPRASVASSPLAGSALLAARAPRAADRDRVLAAVAFLQARNGVADVGAFAAELGEFPARVWGLVSRLQEILNVDGYQVLRADREHRQVRLDLDKLAQQFEVAL